MSRNLNLNGNPRRPATALIQAPIEIRLESGQNFKLATENDYALVCHNVGATLSINAKKKKEEAKELDKTNAILLSTNKQLWISANGNSGAAVTIIRFRPSIHLCLGICPGQLGKNCPREIEERDYSEIKRNELFDLWLLSILGFMHLTNSQSELYELKLRELFYILRMSYPKETMDQFLSSFHCHNQGFRAQVFKLHLQCTSVEELAGKMKLTMSTFKRRFQQEFKTAPLKWMNEERAKHIYKALEEGELSLLEIADRYHFSSLSYLCKFCKRMFGSTPRDLRQHIAAANNESH